MLDFLHLTEVQLMPPMIGCVFGVPEGRAHPTQVHVSVGVNEIRHSRVHFKAEKVQQQLSIGFYVFAKVFISDHSEKEKHDCA